MKILVTGGMGFIGSHLAQKLAQAGHQVTVFDQMKRWQLSPQINFIKGDVTSTANVEKAVLGQDGVVHLSALSKVSVCFERPLECMQVNVLGTMNVLESARKSSKNPWVILTSTRESTSRDVPQAGTTFRKIENLYGISKLVGEMCGERYAIDYRCRIITLKLSDVYGSQRDNPNKVIAKLIRRALENKDLLIQQGKQLFDFIHWQDVTEGFLSAIKKIDGFAGHYYNSFAICSGKKTSLEELVEIILTETCSRSRVLYFHLNVPPSKTYFSSPTRATQVLGFKAKISLQEGVRQTVKILNSSRKNKE